MSLSWNDFTLAIKEFESLNPPEDKWCIVIHPDSYWGEWIRSGKWKKYKRYIRRYNRGRQ